jgi:hypothetical protein
MEPTGIEPVTSIPERRNPQILTSSVPDSLAYSLACQVEKDPNLKLLVEHWHCLQEPVRAGIIAMVKASALPSAANHE